MEWCCQFADIWEDEESGPPCHICPLNEKEINPFNAFCLERWKYLDVTGRDRGFGETPLREEAIDMHLTRYGANETEIYETIFQIEMELFSHRQKEEKDKQEREKKKNSAKPANAGPQKNYSRPIPRRTASLSKNKR